MISYSSRQAGVISLPAAVFLAGMLTFLSFVILIIVSSTSHSRLSMLADAVLYSSVDSVTPEQDSSQIVAVNTDNTIAFTDPDVALNVQEASADATASARVQTDKLVFNDQLVTDDLELSYQASASTEQTTLEIVVMMDVSASMMGTPINQAIAGLQDFAEILYEQERRNYSKTVSIVPATGLTNIGWRPEFLKPAAISFPRGLQTLADEMGWANLLADGGVYGGQESVPGRWRRAMCMALPEVQDELTQLSMVNSAWIQSLELGPDQQNLRFHLETQTKPSNTTYFDGTPLYSYYPQGNDNPYRPAWSHMLALFDFIECGTSSIQAMMSNKQELLSAIDTIIPQSGTNNAEGVMWAWRLLSPQWRGEWDSSKSELPRDYGVETNRKIMLLFTDGDHLNDVARRDRKQVMLCRQMKKQGIEIIAIDFNNTSASLKTCASSGAYYRATSSTIRTVLQQIASTLNQIQLTE